MPHLPLAGASNVNALDMKANGEVSRMRSHKGMWFFIVSPATPLKVLNNIR